MEENISKSSLLKIKRAVNVYERFLFISLLNAFFAYSHELLSEIVCVINDYLLIMKLFFNFRFFRKNKKFFLVKRHSVDSVILSYGQMLTMSLTELNFLYKC